MPSNPDRFLVVVVAFDRVIPFHLSVPCIVFGDGLPDGHPVEVVVCAGEAGELSTSAGFGLSGLAPLDVLHQADAIVVPGWRDLAERPPEPLLDALRTADRRGAQIVGLCLGTQVLAAAGLLEGRRATTHWESAREMAERFPNVRIDANVDGRLECQQLGLTLEIAADSALILRDTASGEALLTEAESLARRNVLIEQEIQRLRQALEERDR